jgi:hypothetical protein
MNLKTLLLGSAAVLVAASAAKAADAIVVEPEPVEYVRICDAYGSGWFYIPGTETCIKFDGDVRVQYGFIEYHDEVQDETSLHEFNYRGRLNVRANNETEYGTLSSRIRFVGEGSAGAGDCDTIGITGFDSITNNTGHCDLVSRAEGPGSAGVLVDTAWISLAGFTIGFDDDYWSSAGGYGYYEARFDGFYGYGNGLFAQYTWSGNGFAATIGLQDGNASGEAGSLDIYGGVTYTGNGWYLAGIYYHDATLNAGAWKVRADYDFGSNGFAVGGWYMADDGETDYVKGHAWGVTAKMNIAENMVLFGGYSSYADQYNTTPAICGSLYASGCGANASADTYTVGVAWNMVPGLLIQPEWTSQWWEDASANGGNFGRFSLRIVRSF